MVASAWTVPSDERAVTRVDVLGLGSTRSTFSFSRTAEVWNVAPTAATM